MKMMTHLKVAAMIASLFAASGSFAATYTEVGDAGETIGTAQAVTGGTSIISGYLGSSGADLFSFGWGGGAFYVNTVGTAGDSQLFLFSSTGVGILGNDDGIAIGGPAYISTASLAAGSYLLGISGYNRDPYSSAGLMFQSSPFAPVYGPNNLSPLSYWSGGGSVGNYVINFQQITSGGTPVGDPNPTGGVPDASSSLVLIGLGLAGLVMFRRRK